MSVAEPGDDACRLLEAGHAEMAPHLDAVLATIGAPDHREPDDRPGRERLFKQEVGPSRWLMVVADFGRTWSCQVSAKTTTRTPLGRRRLGEDRPLGHANARSTASASWSLGW